ncbi:MULTISPECIES: hypothetical protein [Brochothrix]|uniref:Uncharacterized protein n=1 Tax=Brochothrix thermosphacta TaxID=2756 RepID=A0A2X0Q7Q7_BROTH|nr:MULTISPECIES: hypothetical protein [Brochothrix]SLN01420.1 hypothetical protein FM106_20575 [Brachybacterium faecium]MBR5525500.1 hypothetical protein [Brochothrix sp.]ODJ52472.1 hypothetical protein BFR38_11595 [Brochothrix thermosphacta]ODJ60561.1 hypothetical protein BFR42_11075 [Brochothrix thermosphacta]ODJ63633.1 hypothetical protein BFR35_08485 [Brochothrix thermosphacta]
MLTFEQKEAIIDQFSELKKQPVSLKRINYHYEESEQEKTILVRHLHPNGNIWIYAPFLAMEETDDKGYVNGRDYSEKQLIAAVQAGIDELQKDESGFKADYKETWANTRLHQKLVLAHEKDMWQVLTDDGNIEMAFYAKTAAESYLEDEGFFKSND